MSEIEHFSSELVELDKQIVGLGTFCGLDTTQDKVINAILRDEILPEQFPQDRREMFTLLKALLSMRYKVEKQCLDDFGPSKCREILDTTQLK